MGAARSAMRRPPQLEQKPRPLHEKATSRSSPQPVHRNLANPPASQPQRRKARNSASTNPGRQPHAVTESGGVCPDAMVIRRSTPTSRSTTAPCGCSWPPLADGTYPGVLFYSDIFQLTGPTLRGWCGSPGMASWSRRRRSTTASSPPGRSSRSTTPAGAAGRRRRDPRRRLRRRLPRGARLARGRPREPRSLGGGVLHRRAPGVPRRVPPARAGDGLLLRHRAARRPARPDADAGRSPARRDPRRAAAGLRHGRPARPRGRAARRSTRSGGGRTSVPRASIRPSTPSCGTRPALRPRGDRPGVRRAVALVKRCRLAAAEALGEMSLGQLHADRIASAPAEVLTRHHVVLRLRAACDVALYPPIREALHELAPSAWRERWPHVQGCPK